MRRTFRPSVRPARLPLRLIMDSATWLLAAVALAVLISLVLLAVTCVRCRDRGPMRSIPQADSAEEPADLRVIVQPEPPFDRAAPHQTSNHLQPPFSPAAGAVTQQRPRPLSPDSDSNASYENQGNGSDPDDDESNGYITVVPVDSNQSGQSTPSLHSYENVPEKKDDREYQNVEAQNGSGSTSSSLKSTSDQSVPSDSDTDSDDDDDGTGNYVNVQKAAKSG